MNFSYEKYKQLMQKIADVNYSSAVLQWDQEVYMPDQGARYRAQQISTLSGIVHELSTSDELGNLLKELINDATLSSKEKVNIRESLRYYTDQKKYTTEFVIKLNQTISESFQAWQKAKKENSFKIFQPLLEKLVELKKQECEILGYEEHPYDALLNQYEPGSTTKKLQTLFEGVKNELVPFFKRIMEQPKPDDSFLKKHYDKDKQWKFGLDVLKQMNFDFNAGRQDISTHPFTTNFNSKDVRVTTRINENDFREMTWSCIHEGGHALYEQGLSIDDYGLPSGEYLSLAIHESQSRLWENSVGRSLHFWKHNYPLVQNIFPENLKNISLEQFYKAINVVEPSLIRTNADELTYHFHVMIRFGMEVKLLEGSIKVSDLPEIWNKAYKDYLGLDVPDEARGVLQDIHWSHGSFGYFPTYSQGSIYAAQFFSHALKEVPQLDNEIAKGNLKPLLEWLREKIHCHGKTYKAHELCKMITGEELNFQYFMNYSKNKYSKMYNLA
ncbi:MAG: carboxypeptidase M32 [Bacteroidia bacterium]